MKIDIFTLVILILLIIILGCSIQKKVPIEDVLDNMKIHVSVEDNRSVSFTNKEAAYYYTQTHENKHPEWSYFKGLNIAKQKIFSGYSLFLNDDQLKNRDADVWVYPHKMVRKHHPGITEELWMFDDVNIVEVSVINAREPIGIRLGGNNVKFLKIDDSIVYFSSNEGNKIIAVAAKFEKPIRVVEDKVITSPKSEGFYIAVGDTPENAASLILDVRKSTSQYKKMRQGRMRNLLAKNTFLKSDNKNFQLAMNWMVMTMDQLVTRQQGYGIYAGLPWFNEYWGRDEFIALPGACLVTGQFEVAAKILTSFAEYQEIDPNSEFFGRVPNIVNPKNIDYHTTDGTPRFIIQLQEYVKYSGDTTIIRKLYPNVRYSIEGSLKNRTDEKGYLLHADNETWMDARRDTDLMPYSPRGSRANDIQALWYNQLLAGVYFADVMNDKENKQKWQEVADKVKSNFEKDFKSDKYDYLADRLDENDKADYQLRPNQLFALDMVEDQSFIWQATRKCWEELVYPWGVASLNRQDDFFHPFHGAWEHYHKDEAYHNGTVWLWNNGIAMQRMIEAQQQETAYLLFKNMNRQALTKGVVGGLGENMDAYPHSGENWPNLTGTYLQAWSNSEHLRVWYQYFLGIRPDMINNLLTLAPRIPAEMNTLNYKFFIGEGYVDAAYTRKENRIFRYTFNDISTKVEVDIFPFEKHIFKIAAGQTLEVKEVKDQLKITIVGNTGETISKHTAEKCKERVATIPDLEQMFKGTEFCNPLPEMNHKVLKQIYKRN